MGTNRHQDFSVLGNALPISMQWRFAKKLRDAGLKVIRTHYVIDPAFMDACDELGVFALVEVPGWQFWNNESVFGERVYSDIRNMIRIHRNHASLFFWEPILNEHIILMNLLRRRWTFVKKNIPILIVSQPVILERQAIIIILCYCVQSNRTCAMIKLISFAYGELMLTIGTRRFPIVVWRAVGEKSRC